MSNVTFSADMLFCQWVEERQGYKTSVVHLTCRDDVRKLLNSFEKTTSTHLDGKFSVYSNPQNFMDTMVATASVVDVNGSPMFWAGDFLLCKHNGSVPVDMDDMDMIIGCSKVKATFLEDIDDGEEG